MAAARSRRAPRTEPLPFSRKLVLNQWMLGLFEVERFEQLAEHLRDERMEGVDETGVHRFCHEIVAHLFERKELSRDQLLEYDANIVAHTRRINERRLLIREEPITWKYFQYLTLLFVEIYLDRYFHDPEGLLRSINARIAAYNADKAEEDRVTPLDEMGEARTQLNKLAFWSATGSGKTLLMHVNLLQYRHYLARAGRTRELNRVLLLTPGEGLSRQHLEEFEKAGIEAEIFQEGARGLFDDKAVEVIEITKLREERKEKTFDVESFLGNNLVLVDEGHRGASGGEEGKWMKRRDVLCARGFSFEYSATFGQAVRGDAKLEDAYAKSILFDYSYRWFYGDGFGKDYQLLNLDKQSHEQQRDLYLTACLLSFFQQLWLYQEGEQEFRPFEIARPLWVFVGGSVKAIRKESKEQVSDVVSVLMFLQRFVGDRATSVEHIRRVLGEGLVSSDSHNVLHGRFRPLQEAGFAAEEIFERVLALVFNAPNGGALRVENVKGADGEIALKLGDNPDFGIINVGDANDLEKLCADKGLITSPREFRGSIFHELNQPTSCIHLLIGSKKFSEGWSSWRVSTMGLMNVGTQEGSQIIQLFGRGVRLRGYAFCLKRSRRAPLPSGVRPPKHIEALETLGIFGVRADYMEQFAKFLEEEDIPVHAERLEVVLPILKDLGTKKLRLPRVKQSVDGVPTLNGFAYRKLARIPCVAKPDPQRDASQHWLRRNRVVLDWYPKIRSRSSSTDEVHAARKNVAFLEPRHLAFVDIDRAHERLERFKAEKGYYNLNVSKSEVEALLLDPTWYALEIPASELELGGYERTQVWQEIVEALLREYVERYYDFMRSAWEKNYREYRHLDESDPNFLVRDAPEESGYRIRLDESQRDIEQKLLELKAAIIAGQLKPVEMRELRLLWFARHLYQPLIYLENSKIEISPAALNPGERRFVEDLARFHEQEKQYFVGKELYLLRNQTRGRGLGFFEAGNFHPDFIVWLLVGGVQHVAFVDPKGLHNVGVNDAKVRFHETIKELEAQLGDRAMHLHSFLISRTPSHELQLHWSLDKNQMVARHVLFQDEDKDTYVRAMLDAIQSDVVPAR